MTDFHFTPINPDDLAAKVAEIVLKQLEPRLQALERAITERGGSEYLTPGDVARRFRISRDTLRALVELGHIQRYDAGSHGRYKADQLERYLKRYHVNGSENGK